MTPELPSQLLKEGLVLVAVVGGPMFAALLVVGIVFGILQSATQVNDPALAFVPRAATAGLVCIVGGPWMLERLAGFLAHAITRMSGG